LVCITTALYVVTTGDGAARRVKVDFIGANDDKEDLEYLGPRSTSPLEITC
jgi:hypothetical protein